MARGGYLGKYTGRVYTSFWNLPLKGACSKTIAKKLLKLPEQTVNAYVSKYKNLKGCPLWQPLAKQAL